ncbi:MAG: ankyrin repeat domain-containing protein [Holosporales bacterium]|jgi:ankyrin repeat protein|nr:ankyrin repeat domain-containing protein [Holosporales bacterium]
MKGFYKTTALVSLLELGISNLFCGELGDANIDQATDSQEFLTRKEVGQLFDAVAGGNGQEVEKLISDYMNAFVNVRKSNGITPLYTAASLGHTEAVRALLAAGANREIKGTDGSTPLFIAAWNGKIEAIKVLIEAGANVNAQNNRGDTPLHYAAFKGHTEVVKVLLAAGADKEARDRGGDTPRDLAPSASLKTLLA